MAKQMSRNEALERIEFRVRHSCPEANGSNIGDCDECWRYPCNDMKALLVLRDLTEKERPHGEWIKKYNADDPTTACSVCGFDTEDKVYFNFCPNCGADMREGDEK